MTAGQLRQLRTLNDGTLTASASIGGPDLRILKDTVAPTRAPTATPRPGTYDRAQLVALSSPAGTEIHYTLDGSAPTLADPVAARQIRIASTKTIKAAAFDQAGNKGPVGIFRYVIR